MTVAMAAPLTPSLSVKIKIGSRAMLTTFPPTANKRQNPCVSTKSHTEASNMIKKKGNLCFVVPKKIKDASDHLLVAYSGVFVSLKPRNTP